MVALSLLAASASRGATFKVGTFVKTGAAAPAAQVVPHGLGQLPKALIFWTEGNSSDGAWTPNMSYSVGMTDGATSFTSGAYVGNGSTPTNSMRHMSAEAISIVGQTSILAAASLSSWDASSFTLNWTTNNSTGFLIHFIALGGAEVDAKVVSWQMNIGPGLVTVGGVGFKPDVVLHQMTGTTFATLPQFSAAGHVGFGAMDVAGNQWGLDDNDTDAVPIAVSRCQRTGVALSETFSSAPARADFEMLASLSSMDADGFTVNFSQGSGPGDNGWVASLALKGLAAKVGSFAKTGAAPPAMQTVSGLGLWPQLVLLASAQMPASMSADGDAGRMGFGASDGTRSFAVAHGDEAGVNPSQVSSIQTANAAFIKSDQASVTEALATVSALSSGAFTLSWIPNDSVATQVLYVALGSKVPSLLLITNPPRTGTSGACFGAVGKLTVALADGSRNAFLAPDGGVAVTASSSSAGAVFFVDPNCMSPADGGTFTLPAATSTVDLYYEDPTPGSPLITVSGTGLSSASQTEVVVSPDAGGSSDAGDASDAGPEDAGSASVDGGADAGDAGRADAGVGSADAGADAGSGDGGTRDAGSTGGGSPVNLSVGCGCGAGSGWPGLWAVVALCTARRPRGGRRLTAPSAKTEIHPPEHP
jgi:hypothetical protein